MLIVFLPILTLEGVEGKLFKPMALTMIFALLGSLVLSLTLMPVLASLFLTRAVKEQEPWLAAGGPSDLCAGAGRRVALPQAHARRRRWRLLAGAVFLATRMGGEFLPKLGEGAIVGTTVRVAGISVEEAVAVNDRIEKLLLVGVQGRDRQHLDAPGQRRNRHRPDGR